MFGACHIYDKANNKHCDQNYEKRRNTAVTVGMERRVKFVYRFECGITHENKYNYNAEHRLTVLVFYGASHFVCRKDHKQYYKSVVDLSHNVLRQKQHQRHYRQ